MHSLQALALSIALLCTSAQDPLKNRGRGISRSEEVLIGALYTLALSIALLCLSAQDPLRNRGRGTSRSEEVLISAL